MGTEPRDGRELEVHAEIGTGSLLPGGKLAVIYRRIWDKRRDDFIDATAAAADMSSEEIFNRVEDGDEISDIFLKAGERAVSNGSKGLQDFLAKLVAAALRDDAKIEPIAFAMDCIAQLEPIHIRIISTFREPQKAEMNHWEEMEAERRRLWEEASARPFVGTQPPSPSQALPIEPSTMAICTNSSYEMVISALYKLRDLGVVEVRGGEYVPPSSTRSIAGYLPEEWLPRPLGYMLCDIIGEVASKIVSTLPDTPSPP